jgi:hypothetical protein
MERTVTGNQDYILSVRLTSYQRKQLERFAGMIGWNKTDVVREAIAEYLDRHWGQVFSSAGTSEEKQ